MAEQVLLPIKCERLTLLLTGKNSSEKIHGYAFLYKTSSPLDRFFDYAIAINWHDTRERFCRYKTFKGKSFQDINSELEKLASNSYRNPVILSWDKGKETYELKAA